MINLVVNGQPFTDFVNASATLSLVSMANDFSFTASAVDGFPPFKQGDLVEVSVNDVKKITGYIEQVSGSDREGSHTVNYSGRDKTGDFIDSTMNVIGEIKASESLTLKKIIEIVIAHLGLDLKVIDTYNPKAFNQAEDIVKPDIGASAFEFVMAYARKRQALLSSDADGNIVITQSLPIDSDAILQSIFESNSNNILSQDWEIDSTQTFNKYIYRGQLDPLALNFAGDSGSVSIEAQGGEVTNSDVRAGRQKVVVESESYSDGQLKDRAKWSKQIADSNQTKFNCVSKDHVNSEGALWQENSLVQINSDSANISRKMLLNTLIFSEGEGEPTVTQLSFVEQNVYTIDEKILNQRPVGDLNDAFTLG